VRQLLKQFHGSYSATDDDDVNRREQQHYHFKYVGKTFKLLNPSDYLRTTRFNTRQFCMVLTLLLCVLYDLTTNSDFFPDTTFADWFYITEMESVYSAVRTRSLYKTDTFSL
jgi:hypothetical protein